MLMFNKTWDYQLDAPINNKEIDFMINYLKVTYCRDDLYKARITPRKKSWPAYFIELQQDGVEYLKLVLSCLLFIMSRRLGKDFFIG